MVSVAIIGGGICGCSLLYELSRYNVNAILIEKENDIAIGTTKANSAIVHAGYDPMPSTKMAKYNVWGSSLIKQLCEDLDVAYKQVGSMVIAFTPDQEKILETLFQRGIQNGVPKLEIISKEKVLQMEPNLNPDIRSALYAPSAAIVSPWNLTIAMAEVAVTNGAQVMLNTKVQGIEKSDGYFKIKTDQETIEAEYVVNAAGIHADEINDMAAEHNFSINPSKGEYYLLDKSQGDLVSHVIFQCPDKNGKGVLVAPTVDGNLIAGPNAVYAPKDDVSTTSEGLSFVKQLALKSVPSINFRETIRNFSGLRAVTEYDDFIIGESETQKGFFNISGMKSPGLSSAPAIAVDMVKMLENSGLTLTPKKDFISKRHIVRFKHLSHEQRAEAIKKNPLYASIVCRCETVTEGEIIDALHRPIVPQSIEAIKRRCGAGMGRCQGGFCGPKVQQIIARELKIDQKDIPLDRMGMDIIVGTTKGGKLDV